MRRTGLVVVVVATLIMMLVATSAGAQEEIEAKAGKTVAHPLICHAMAGKAEAFAC